MSPWLCFLPQLSLSGAVTAAPLVHERSYSLQQELGGSGTVSSEQSSGSTMHCYINIYSSLSAPSNHPHPHPHIPALFCCFNHFHHGPISSRKSRALHLLRTVTGGFSDVSQSQHYHSCFSCARQVFRCRSSIEPLALFRAVHSAPIF